MAEGEPRGRTAAGPQGAPERRPPPGGPRLFVLLGSPVAHSLSPRIHRAAFRAMGVDAVYAALPTEAGEVEALMRAVARSGGGNVTLPHKERAARLLDRRSEAADATGACNCFWEEDGRLAGDNTDVEGFLEALSGLLPEPGGDGPVLRGARVLIAGAGGGARAVLHAASGCGAGGVEVLNRTVERAEEMVADVVPGSDLVRVLPGPEAVSGRYDLVVNATSLGLRPGDPLPVELDGLEAGAAFDLVYGARDTRWSREARRRGIPSRDGLEMLVCQAAASLRRWLGRSPPLDVLRDAARRGARGSGEGAPGRRV